MRQFPLITFLALSLVLAFMLVQGAPKNMLQTTLKSLPVLKVRALEDNSAWQQETLKDHDATLINFFASWCVPCAAEMPELAALKKKFPNLHMVGIAWNDKPETIHRWLKKNGNPFDSVWLDDNGETAISLGVRGIPETMIIDGKGVIRFRFSGVLTEEMREGELSIRIDELFNEVRDGY